MHVYNDCWIERVLLKDLYSFACQIKIQCYSLCGLNTDSSYESKEPFCWISWLNFSKILSDDGACYHTLISCRK